MGLPIDNPSALSLVHKKVETAMKFYVASSITNKAEVRKLFDTLKTKGHEVTTDWTLTDEIPEEAR
jgi:hypothetical protein